MLRFRLAVQASVDRIASPGDWRIGVDTFCPWVPCHRSTELEAVALDGESYLRFG